MRLQTTIPDTLEIAIMMQILSTKAALAHAKPDSLCRWGLHRSEPRLALCTLLRRHYTAVPWTVLWLSLMNKLARPGTELEIVALSP